MAVQFSAISNLWTDATWQTVDTTSYLKSEAGSTTTTTSYVASSTFTPGIITVEGILLRVKGTTTTPTGTFSVELYNSTGAASVATVTCNATDITNNNTNLDGGWMYFKFGSPVTLLAATAYSVRIKSSVNATVTVYRNTTAGNWSRGLVTSTTASLSANDDVIVCGNVTAAATTTVNTVTFDYTGANAYNSVEVGAYGKLIGENSAYKNYKLTINDAGLFLITHNGIVEFSTSSSRLPTTSTFVILLTCSARNTNYLYVRNYGTFRAFGSDKIRSAKLTADVGIGGTTLTTNITTNWKSGDNIYISNTETISTTQVQSRTLAIDSSGTTVTIPASSFVTKGTSPYVTDVINLTSNFSIIGTSAANATNTSCQIKSILDVDNIEYSFTSTAVFIYTGVGGSCSIKNCSISNSNTLGFTGAYNIYTDYYSSNYTIDGLVIGGTQAGGIYFLTSNLASCILSNCVIIGGAQGYLGSFRTNTTISNCIAANLSGTGFTIGYQNGVQFLGGVCNNITAYNCASVGVQFGISAGLAWYLYNSTFSNINVWRNGYGLALYSFSTIINNLNSFGNTLNNISCYVVSNCTINNSEIQGGITRGTWGGIYIDSFVDKLIFKNSNIATTTSHTNWNIASNQFIIANISFNNCSFGGSVNIAGNSTLQPNYSISIQRKNGNSGSNEVYKEYGSIISNDITIFNITPSSQRITPANASYKTSSTSFKIPVASGSTATVTVKVRKSVIGDGTAYNGNQPRLILKSNPSAGSAYNSDIVAATATNAANGAWETLSYTLPVAVTDNVGMEFYVDCDGTTGWVNVDTFISNNNNSMTYYLNGEPINDIVTATSSEQSFTFVA